MTAPIPLFRRLKAVQDFSDRLARRLAQGRRPTVEVLPLADPPSGGPLAWLDGAARQVTEGLRLRFEPDVGAPGSSVPRAASAEERPRLVAGTCAAVGVTLRERGA